LEGRILRLPLGKGNKLKERSWRLTKGEGSLLGWEKEKGRKGVCEKKEKKRLVLMCGKVLFMKKMCARIKHGRISMTSLWSFISNSCSSQIHCWICVKLKTILV
jgi:hypothetical protein